MTNVLHKLSRGDATHPLTAIWIGVVISLLFVVSISATLILTYRSRADAEISYLKLHYLISDIRLRSQQISGHARQSGHAYLENDTRFWNEADALAACFDSAYARLALRNEVHMMAPLFRERERFAALTREVRLNLKSTDISDTTASAAGSSIRHACTEIERAASMARFPLLRQQAHLLALFDHRIRLIEILGVTYFVLLVIVWTTVVRAVNKNIYRTITAEQARYESEARYGSLIETLPFSVVIVQDGKIAFANQAAAEILGFAAVDRIIGRSLEEFIPVSERAHVLAIHENRLVSSGAPRSYTTRLIRENGDENPVEVHARAVTYQGRPAAQAVIADIAERIRSEQVLKESEERFRSLADAAPVLIWMAGVGRHTYYFNKRWLQFTGRRMAQEFGRGWIAGVHPDDAQQVLQTYQAAFDAKNSFTVEYRLSHSDGTYHWLLETGVPRFIQDGAFTGYIGSCADITDHKRAMQQIAMLSRAVECSPDSIIVADLSGVIEYVNPIVLRSGGWDHSGQVVGRSVFDFTTGEGKVRLANEILPHLTANGTWHGEIDILRSNAEIRLSEMVCAVVPDESGKPTHLLAMIRDISARKRDEAQLARRAHDLEDANRDLEHFAYVVSHDLRDPLRAMSGFAHLLKSRYGSVLDRDGQDFVEFIDSEAQRLQSMLHDLLIYSRVRTQGKPFEPLDSEQAARQALLMLNGLIEETNAEVTFGALPAVVGDKAQLEMAFIQLIENAVKFHGENPPRVHVWGEETDSEWVFHVRDNGLGIDPRYFDRIFTIFRRMHGRNEYPGTGAGLALCKRIATRHGGRIWVDSEPQNGSTFHFAISKRARQAAELPA